MEYFPLYDNYKCVCVCVCVNVQVHLNKLECHEKVNFFL